MPTALLGQIFPIGPEFRVNSYTPGLQFGGFVTAANGDFVVTWVSEGMPSVGEGLDSSDDGVFGRRYTSSGLPIGSEFQVNTYTTNNQWDAQVARDVDGDFVVVWLSDGQDGSYQGVFAQRYLSSGAALGSEFQVNTYTTDRQWFPAVASDADGDFVVVWASFQLDGYEEVFAQRYASSGIPVGTEFQVNSYTPSSQRDPAVAVDAAGNLVVIWESFAQDGSSSGVFGQRYASSGTAVGSEFQVNTYTTDVQAHPAVAAEPDGDFVVVWNSGNGSGEEDVFGQRFTSSGNATGTEFQINAYTTGLQAFSAIAADADGDFIVVWFSSNFPQDGQDGSGAGVFGRYYDSAGGAVSSEFQVNTQTTGFQGGATVATRPDGDFVVVWTSNPQYAENADVFGQRFTLTPPVPPVCPPTALTGCSPPGKSLLLIKDSGENGAGAEDKLVWKWLKGPLTTQVDFGYPILSASYVLCVYAGTAVLEVMEAVVPSAGTCAGNPCWKQLGTKGFKRKDPLAAADGISKMVLKAGDPGQAKIIIKGTDGSLELNVDTLPLDDSGDVIVQISHTDNGNCWEAVFPPGAVVDNTDGQFKAKTP